MCTRAYSCQQMQDISLFTSDRWSNKGGSTLEKKQKSKRVGQQFNAQQVHQND